MNQQPGEPITPERNHDYQKVLDGDSTVADVLRLQANVAQTSEPIALERYTSPDFFALEMRKMWAKVWQFACREEHIPEIGDYTVYDIGRHSILIVRAAKDEIKAYHNSCMHRGTKLKPSGTNGSSAEIQCPFHGWTYQLDGTLDEVPCSWEFPHLDYEANHLAEVQAGTWNSLVFINMDMNAPPLLDYLEDLPDHFRNWDYTDWAVSVHARKELPCNWKAAQEAFIEGYHGPMVHPQVTATAANAQHDIFSDHVSRDIVALGVASRRARDGKQLSEQQVLDAMLMGDSTLVGGDRPKVPKGGTARAVVVQTLRETFLEAFGLDLSDLSESEIIDSIKYTLFPNLFLFAGINLRVLYQYRPLGDDPDRCLFDIMFMKPVPKDGPRPDPAEVVHVGEDDSYLDVPGMDPSFGLLFDQDTAIMRWHREGIHASATGQETYSNYLESRLRHIHGVLDKYLQA